jgi:hypothetical protein
VRFILIQPADVFPWLKRPVWVVNGLSLTQGAVQAVADFIVASERCKTVRQAFVANIICKDSVPESARFIEELVANFIVGPH